MLTRLWQTHRTIQATLKHHPSLCPPSASGDGGEGGQQVRPVPHLPPEHPAGEVLADALVSGGPAADGARQSLQEPAALGRLPEVGGVRRENQGCQQRQLTAAILESTGFRGGIFSYCGLSLVVTAELNMEK